LPAAQEVGGEILFRLRILNSVWILILAVEGKLPPCCNPCVKSAATRVCWGFNLIYLVVGLVVSHFVCLSLKKQ
jgi:hypothetical protein